MPMPTEIHEPETTAASAQRQRALGTSGASVETIAPRSRRKFSAAEKLRIVRKADACLANGPRGALEGMLREEGIYRSTLAAWRTQLGAKGKAGLEPQKVGRKPKLDARDRHNAELIKRNAVLERKLYIADAIIALQKKAHEILGIVLPASEGEL
jgi:transposase-like protein